MICTFREMLVANFLTMMLLYNLDSIEKKLIKFPKMSHLIQMLTNHFLFHHEKYIFVPHVTVSHIRIFLWAFVVVFVVWEGAGVMCCFVLFRIKALFSCMKFNKSCGYIDFLNF